MDTENRSFEASLLFPAALVSSDLAMLADDIKMLCAAHGLPARRVATHAPAVIMFDCGALQVLAIGCDTPLEVAHFLDSARPADAMLHDTAVLARLTSHRYSMTILIADHPDRPQPDCMDRRELKEKLCWQIAEQIRSSLRPSLVFWCENDTLYSGEEFARSGPFGAPLHVSGPATLAEGQRLYEVQRALEARALTYIQTQIIQGAHRNCGPTAPRHDAAQIPAGRAAALLTLAKRNSDQMMRGATMACSTAAAGICMLPQIPGVFT